MHEAPTPNPRGLARVASASAALLGFLVLTFLAPLTGVLCPPGSWYDSLTKPAWTPPPAWFGPVWTLLYTMMAVAAWLVWRQGGWSQQRRPLALYAAQLVLNAAWTPLFFGLRQPGLALVAIVLLWLAILATARAFWRASKPASILLWPYAAWVGFATALNAALWSMNP